MHIYIYIYYLKVIDILSVSHSLSLYIWLIALFTCLRSKVNLEATQREDYFVLSALKLLDVTSHVRSLTSTKVTNSQARWYLC